MGEVWVKKSKNGRPLRSESDTFEAAFLEQAMMQFRRSGYRASTMASLAQSFGTTKMTLYRRFSSKPALLAKLIDMQTSTIAARLQAVPATLDRPPYDTLLDFGTIMQRHHGDPAVRALWQAVSEARDDLGDDFTQITHQAHVALDPIVTYFDLLITVQRMDRVDAKVAATAFAELAGGGLTAFLASAPSDSHEISCLSFVVTLFSRGLSIR